MTRFGFVFIAMAMIMVSMSNAAEEQESVTNIKAQRSAVKAWAETLHEEDYDADHWSKTHGNQPANFFEHYASRLSDIFKDHGAKVNFALVGACDGTNDRTIRDRYLPNEHWRGVFVEPFSINFKDLSMFVETHKVSHRSHLIHAAATRQCNSSTIKMKRPTFEEKNASLPHWMRRQIGAVVPFTKLSNKMTGGWVAEYTRCVSGPEILQDWTDALNHRSFPTAEAAAADKEVPEEDAVEGEEGAKKKRKGRKGGGKMRMLRPHVLKVDVEGHDFEVLMGFLGEGMTQSMLPLMINFEAKSITAQFPQLRETMEKRGYAVSHFATDGFAMLRADAINKRPSSFRAAGAKKGASETETGEGGADRGKEAEEAPVVADRSRPVDDAIEQPEGGDATEGGESVARAEGKKGRRGGKKGRGGKGRGGGKGKRKGVQEE